MLRFPPETATRWNAAARRERKRVCVHEAAHAVAALICGGSARVRLTITPHPNGLFGFSGLTTVTSPDRGFVAAAGVVGEAKFAMAKGWSAPQHACVAADMRCVDDFAIDDFGQHERIGVYGCADVVMERARAALDDPATWTAVLYLGDALGGVWPDSQLDMASRDSQFMGEMSAQRVAAICAGVGIKHGRAAVA